MKSSALIESVSFDAPLTQPDGQGGIEEGWDLDNHRCRAHFKYLRGGETVQQARLQGKQPVVVTIRATAAAALRITTDFRMRDLRRDDEYNIRSIVPSDNRLYLELTCEKGVVV